MLGPVGAGKTTALQTISQDCGDGVVHAFFDFERTQPVTTVEALAQIAFNLSRRWTARRAARFTRFTLGLIAVQAQLDELSHDQAKEALRKEIEGFFRSQRSDQLIGAVQTLADAAEKTKILPSVVAVTVKMVLPPLIRTLARRSLTSRAERWHADIPEAEGATPLDALVALNRRARAHPDEMTPWLTAAFLADVRENHPRMATPDPYSPCACKNPSKIRHLHNWIVLLDNIDHEGGARFLSDLSVARERHLRHNSDDHDALVVIATSGRWNPEWESAWRPPWQPTSKVNDLSQVVPRCRDAGYRSWYVNAAARNGPSRWYPVLLEPLEIDETARILEVGQFSSRCTLVQRATGGLPQAVHALAHLLGNSEIRPGGRDVLLRPDQDLPEADSWRRRLCDLGPIQRLPDIDIDELITVAPFVTAPWLAPIGATNIVSGPRVGRILTELRTTLWVTGTSDDDTSNAELHPWITKTMLTALAERPGSSDLPTYEAQFEALLHDSATGDDPVRRAYCQLALGRIGDVVSLFEADFHQRPHRDWIRRLSLVTGAPDNMSLARDSSELYRELVDQDFRDHPDDRSPIRNVLSRLIAASWLMSNPFAAPDPRLREIIVNAYRELAPQSRRPDVAALYDAATQRARQLF